jgi:hypothetical protein
VQVLQRIDIGAQASTNEGWKSCVEKGRTLRVPSLLHLSRVFGSDRPATAAPASLISYREGSSFLIRAAPHRRACLPGLPETCSGLNGRTPTQGKASVPRQGQTCKFQPLSTPRVFTVTCLRLLNWPRHACIAAQSQIQLTGSHTFRLQWLQNMIVDGGTAGPNPCPFTPLAITSTSHFDPA